MGFGSNLKRILKEKDITIKELSEITGISLNTLYSITKRDTRLPSSEILSKISAALNIKESELITFDVWVSEFDDALNSLDDAINSLRQSENYIREQLSYITNMLGIEALDVLIKQALILLKDNSNWSLIYDSTKIESFLKGEPDYKPKDKND